MKLIYAFLLALVVSDASFGQKYIPHIGVGSVLNYGVVATSTDTHIPLTLKIVSLNDPMKLNWNLPGLGTGNFLIPAKALETGTKMRLEEPNPNNNTVFKDDETIMFVSKASLADLNTTQVFILNKIKFTTKPLDMPYQINGKDAEVLHAISANGKIEIWVLNNPAFPLICKLTGNPAGIDFDLKTLAE